LFVCSAVQCSACSTIARHDSERVISLLSASPVGEARCRCRKVWLARIDDDYYYYYMTPQQGTPMLHGEHPMWLALTCGLIGSCISRILQGRVKPPRQAQLLYNALAALQDKAAAPPAAPTGLALGMAAI
jgi:hypothetical protein